MQGARAIRNLAIHRHTDQNPGMNKPHLSMISGIAIALIAASAPTVFAEKEKQSPASAPKIKTPEKAESAISAARRAFEGGAHAEAVKLALPLAEKGDADAIYLLGFAHETGQGAELSPKKAEEFYRKGLAKNHPDSAYRLAFMLLGGKDKARITEAQALLEKQALIEPAIAGRILGEAFLLGRFSGTPDPEKAILWWKKSADVGDIPSMLFLARFYDGQMGFPEKTDLEISTSYFEKAAAAGNTAAMVTVGARLLYGPEKGRDEKRGLDFLGKAIAANDAAAYQVRGNWQEIIKQDSKAALAEYERGAAANHLECMVQAAQYYLDGKGTKKDTQRGTDLLKKAAEGGNAQAHFFLAAQILKVEKADRIVGYGHLLAAANGGLPTAQNELGLFYLSGALGLADINSAVAWFTQAAKSNFPSAQNNLAALFERGTGVERNYATAAQLYTAAAQQGNAPATLALARFQAAGVAGAIDLPRAWALGKIAENRGEQNAAKFLETLEKDFTKDQLSKAKEQLELLSGKQPAKK